MFYRIVFWLAIVGMSTMVVIGGLRVADWLQLDTFGHVLSAIAAWLMTFGLLMVASIADNRRETREYYARERERAEYDGELFYM